MADYGGVRRHLNRVSLAKLAGVAVLMFAFGYAMVPMYRVFCEITGINVLTPIDAGAARFARNSQVDTSRVVTIEFDANSRGPWSFRPKVGHLELHPGELTSITYELTNNEDRTMKAQAIPSYAPIRAGSYFRKLECFCFTQQTLEAHQVRSFPVVFVIDPKLPRDVATITLSYTFFEVGGAVAAQTQSGRHG